MPPFPERESSILAKLKAKKPAAEGLGSPKADRQLQKITPANDIEKPSLVCVHTLPLYFIPNQRSAL